MDKPDTVIVFQQKSLTHIHLRDWVGLEEYCAGHFGLSAARWCRRASPGDRHGAITRHMAQANAESAARHAFRAHPELRG